jgi:geranylgeranyl pyrophosphate synthase
MMRSMVTEISSATGAAGLIGGEIADIEGEAKPASLESVASVHLSKTARLIEAACVLGGLAARSSNAQLASLREYGKRLGLAFQGQDDLLDATGRSEMMGKPTRRDQRSGKQTYVRAVGEDEARRLVQVEAHRAVAALQPFGDAAGVLRDLATYVIERDA